MAFEEDANSKNKSKLARYANPVRWFKKVWHFIIESKNEVKRITWPAKSKISRSTGIVISTVLVITMFVWLIDSGFNQALSYFFKVLK